MSEGLERCWEQYHTALWPQGFGSQHQADELRLTFLSGMFVSLQLMDKFAEEPEDKAVVLLKIFTTELNSELAEQHAKMAKKHHKKN